MITPGQAGRKGRPVRLSEERAAVWHGCHDEFLYRTLTDVPKHKDLPRQARIGATLNCRRELCESFTSDSGLRDRCATRRGSNLRCAAALQVPVAGLGLAA